MALATFLAPKASPATLVPGIAAACLIALSARYLSDWLGTTFFRFGSSPVSPVMLAVLAGVLIRSLVGVTPRLEAGIALAASAVLRIGLALIGLRLTLAGLGSLGLRALPVVAGCIGVAWLAIPRIARAFGLRGSIVTLITMGTSICGCTAIMAAAPAIRARAEETGYAVTVIVIVGLAGMLLYPMLAHTVFSADAAAAGVFLGAAIHDTSQVMGAALLYSNQYLAPEALDAATVTKLMRNMLLVVAVPVLAAMHARRSGSPAMAGKGQTMRLVPGFVLAFICLAAVRSAGDALGDVIPGFDSRSWAWGLAIAAQSSELLLTIGMAAVGLSVDLHQMLRVGWRPLAAGAVAALLMAVAGLGLVAAFL